MKNLENSDKIIINKLLIALDESLILLRGFSCVHQEPKPGFGDIYYTTLSYQGDLILFNRYVKLKNVLIEYQGKINE